MADKTLNAVPTASNGAFIYAEDANGNQIKISKADLASVVAGLMSVSTRTTKGLLASGVRVYSGSATLSSGQSVNLPYKVAGLLFVKNGYSWSGYNMYHAYRSTLNLLASSGGVNPVSAISVSNGVVTIENNTSGSRTFRYCIINISDPQDTAEDVID